MSTKVTSKGQVTIPKALRERLGIKPGSDVDLHVADDGAIVIVPAKTEKPLDPDRFKKWRGSADTGLSTDDIMEITRGRRLS